MIKAELLKGLAGNPVHIPAWYRYDEEGSRLNDMCMEQCKWYYFHRFEMKILNDISTVRTHMILLGKKTRCLNRIRYIIYGSYYIITLIPN